MARHGGVTFSRSRLLPRVVPAVVASASLALAGCAVTVPRDGVAASAGNGVVSDPALTDPGADAAAQGGVPGAPGVAAAPPGEAQSGSSGAVAPGPAGAAGPDRSDAPASSQGEAVAPPAARSSRLGQGVSAKEVKVGFIVLENTQQQAQNQGFVVAQTGNPRTIVNAFVSWINSRGGMGGRKVVPVFESADINTASAAREAATCTAFVQDHKVFAVVPMALIYEDSRACYAKGGVLLSDASGFPYDKTTFERLSPYYWSPGYPTASRTATSLVAALAKTDYFRGDAKLGIVTYSNASYRRVVERDYLPALKRIGVTDVEVEYIEQTSLASTQSGTNSAVVRLSTAGVNRVIFVGASTLGTFFMNRAESQRYRPRYGLTTWDNPAFMAINAKEASGFVKEEQILNAVGIGFTPSGEVGNAQWPSAREKPCLDVLAKAGIKYNRHYDANRSLQYCSAILFLKAAADKAGATLNAQTFAAAAERLGTSYQAPIGHGDQVGPGRHATGATYRPFRYDTGCRCFSYTAGVTRLVD